MATSAGRVLAAAIAAAIRTGAELIATLARLAGVSVVAVVVIGLMLYSLFA